MRRLLDLFLAVSCGGALAYGALVPPVSPGTEVAPTLCTFRSVTGIDCPFCGMTRSFSALLHGRADDAFLHHPAGPLLAAGMVVLLALVLARAVVRGPPLSERRAFARVLLGAGAACAVAGLVRVLWMAPWGPTP